MPRLLPLAVPAITAAALLALSGCGADTASSTGAAPETTDPDTLSVEQFAGKVSPIKRDFDKSLAKWEDSLCLPSDLEEGDLSCGLDLQLLQYAPELAAIQLNTITKRDAPAYAGQPPAELAELYGRTSDAADAAVKASKAIDPLECKSDSECMSNVSALESQLDNLSDTFAEWDPYL